MLIRDPVSSLTHLLAAFGGLYIFAILWRLARGDHGKRLSLACFAASIIVLYSASGIYHALPLPKDSPAIQAFRRLDHSAIYVLIAGTYTPVFTVLLSGQRRLWSLIGIWSLAATGIAVKWSYPVGTDPFSVGLYLAMGWFGILPLVRLAPVIGRRGLAWSAAGGVAYTMGAIFEMIHWPVIIRSVVGWHEVFHVCVMAGTGFHIAFMVQCILPYRRLVLQEGNTPSTNVEPGPLVHAA